MRASIRWRWYTDRGEERGLDGLSCSRARRLDAIPSMDTRPRCCSWSAYSKYYCVCPCMYAWSGREIACTYLLHTMVVCTLHTLYPIGPASHHCLHLPGLFPASVAYAALDQAPDPRPACRKRSPFPSACSLNSVVVTWPSLCLSVQLLPTIPIAPVRPATKQLRVATPSSDLSARRL